MNKQQLASKIWKSANKMRSKIEANEYKDYILGFIFYKFLSDKEVKYLKNNDCTDEDLPSLSEGDLETVKYVQKNLGYFIAYDNLFPSWIAQGNEKLLDSLSEVAKEKPFVNEAQGTLEVLCKKYENTFAEAEQQSAQTEHTLSGLLDELRGAEFDMQGLAELKKRMGRE